MDQRDVEKGNTKADEITAENESGSQTMPTQKPRTRFKRSDSTASIRTRDIDFSKDTDHTLEPITFKSLFRLIVIFMFPLGILIAIPIVLACTVDSAKYATIGGVPLLQFFIWVEISWVALWGTKLLAKVLPFIVRPFLSGGAKKYCRQLQDLEVPLALVGGTFAMYVSFYPMMHQVQNKNGKRKMEQQPWQTIVQQALAATLCSSLVYLAKCVLITIVNVRYHQTRFATRIKANKEDIGNLIALTQESRKHCGTNDELMKYDQVLFNKADQTLSTIAIDARHAMTNKRVSIHHGFVAQALLRHSTSEALARRIWCSMVQKGHETLTRDDLQRIIYGANKNISVEEKNRIDRLFNVLDIDRNGDVSVDEAVSAVINIHQERINLHRGTTDMQGAVDALDWLLVFACLVLVVFVYIAFMTNQIRNTFAFAGTLLAGSAFAFAGTIQDLMSSIFHVFVKHPYDVGDRIKFDDQEFVVHDISLLFSIFRNLSDNKLLQHSNTVLTNKGIENITRSVELKENIKVQVSFDTSFEDVEVLRTELAKFLEEHSRDYFADSLDVRIRSFGLDKLELQVDVRYKGSWSNQAQHAERKEKFARHLIGVLRKIPIYAPGASGDPGLGSPGNASYSVSISPAEAEERAAAAQRTLSESRYRPAAATTTGYQAS